MKPIHALRPLVGVACVALFSAVAAGQTIIIDPMPRLVPQPDIRPPRPPRPPLRDAAMTVERHAVTVNIIDGAAVTAVEQVFRNPHNQRVEGTYIFPLADDVAVSKFSMVINGQEVEGQLLGVEEARRTYESIVAGMRDPALLEYLGTKMFRARIFPIEPGQEVRVKLSYTQMLKQDDGLVRYRYPLDTEKYLASPVGEVAVLVNVESKTPIRNVFSPTHKVAISRPSDYKASASFEGKNLFPDKNFDLFYALSDKEFGMTVLTYREAGQDGYFLARIAPPAQVKTGDVIPKDVCLVVDTSGSMAGEKMTQAQSALKFCLSSLNREDRFNVVPFSHEAQKFEASLVAATPENVEKARKFADDLKATGGTNINDALLAALDLAPGGDAARPYLIVFLTDGQPTIGVTDHAEILKAVKSRNADRVRLFVFGVGHDVNTKLLDLLAEQNRGAPDYVEPGEDLELKLSSFYRKVSDPVLADVQLSFGDLKVYDLYPPKPGDLFGGSELIITGRYGGEGPRAVELTGTRRGTRERFVYETTFPGETRTHDFLPRLWAVRKVGYLLDEMRLHGDNKELKDTIVELATKHGIVTPYTAFLVTEPGREVAVRWREDAFGRVSQQAMRQQQGGAPAMRPAAAVPGEGFNSVSGRAAVTRSKDMSMLKSAGYIGGDAEVMVEADLDTRDNKPSPTVTRVGARTFYFVGERWIDAAFDEKLETTKLEAFSEAYFEFLRKNQEVAPCLALGERVIVVIDGKAYETVVPPEKKE